MRCSNGKSVPLVTAGKAVQNLFPVLRGGGGAMSEPKQVGNELQIPKATGCYSSDKSSQ
jgi:hypothetical protein